MSNLSNIALRRYPQARYWLLTIAHHEFTPYLPPGVVWIRGQLELSSSGFLHWQLVVTFGNKIRLGGVRSVFGPHHAEPTLFAAANSYVFKDDTYVAGTRFELGSRPINITNKQDWLAIWDAARNNRIDDIPPSIRFIHYNNVRRIASDFAQPIGMERECFVFWGDTGTGKSRLAWQLAGLDAYPKDPRTKWWDGYRSQKHVVCDEFRGCIDIAHFLRWLDRYPVLVETKGSSTPLIYEKIWITSNLDPRLWYPGLDTATYAALLRRLKITHFASL